MTSTTRESVSNALATFEANIAKSGDAQSRCFLSNVAANGDKKTDHLKSDVKISSKETSSTVTAIPTSESPPLSPSRKRQSSRIHTAVQHFEKIVTTPPVSPQKQSVKVSRLKLRSPRESEDPTAAYGYQDTHTTTTDRPRSPRRRSQTQYEYDYKETQKVWQTRTSRERNGEDRHGSSTAREQKQQWSPKQLKSRRKQVKQQSLAQRMPKRGSMGLVGTVSREFKTEDLYPSIHEEVESRRGSGVRAFNSTCNTEDTRSSHRRRRRRRKKNEAKLPPARRRQAKRRNSTGRVRLSEEPVVTIYWNPSGRDNEDEDDLAQSTWRHDEHALCADDYRNAPSYIGHHQHDQSAGHTLDILERKGLIQRRKSTGGSRLTEEPTHWLYARDEHDIAQADIPSEAKKVEAKMATADASKRRVSPRQEETVKGLKRPSRKSSQDQARAYQEEVLHVEEAVRKGKEAASEAAFDHPENHSVVLKQSIPVHEDSAPNAPLRRVERRGSTGAVPLAEEPESRLHRKQKIRRELKRSSGLRRERQSVFRPGAPSPNSPRKASLMGLLDPLSSLADNPEDPRSYLMGDEDHICTFVPLYVPQKPPTPPAKGSDSDSDDPSKAFCSSLRPGGCFNYERNDDDTGIGHSEHSKRSNESSEDDVRAQQVYSMRPGATRGASFSQPREEERGHQSNDSDDGGAACFSMRPGAFRGESFSKPDVSRAEPDVLPTLVSDDDIETDDEQAPTTRSIPLPFVSENSWNNEKKPSDDGVNSGGWNFNIVQPARKYTRYVDTGDGGKVKTQVTLGAIPQKEKVIPSPHNAVVKKRVTAPVPVDDDDDDDSSITSFDSSVSSSTGSSAASFESPNGHAATSPNQMGQSYSETASEAPMSPMSPIRPYGGRSKVDISEGSKVVELTDLSPCDEKEEGNDDVSSSRKNIFADPKSTLAEPLLLPGVMRGLSSENGEELLMVMDDMKQTPDAETPDGSGGSGSFGTVQRYPSTVIDKETLQSLEKAATDDKAELPGATNIRQVTGHPAAHMVKSVAKLEREEKKKKKESKKKKKERKHKKKKHSEPSSSEKADNLASVEDRKRHRKSKSTRKDSNEKEPKLEKKSIKKERSSDKHAKKEHAEKRVKKSCRAVKSSSGEA